MPNPPALDYSLEYADSGHHKCSDCGKAIVRGEVIWGKSVDPPLDHGQTKQTHHERLHFPSCLGTDTKPANRMAQATIVKYGNAADVPGVETLRPADREWAVEALKAVKQGDKPPGRPRNNQAEDEDLPSE